MQVVAGQPVRFAQLLLLIFESGTNKCGLRRVAPVLEVGIEHQHVRCFTCFLAMSHDASCQLYEGAHGGRFDNGPVCAPVPTHLADGRCQHHKNMLTVGSCIQLFPYGRQLVDSGGITPVEGLIKLLLNRRAQEQGEA